jgi:hypothetical protein
VSKAALEALRENPSWSRMSKEWFRCAIWAYRYSEIPPSRDDIAKALVATQHAPTRDHR